MHIEGLEEFTCMARVRFRGKELALNKVETLIDIEQMRPPNIPEHDPMRAMQASEQRQRFVDLLAGQFAQALTQALFDIKR